MSYNKRNDGRAFDELRPMDAKVGIIKNALGSAMFRIGKTVALAAVYGPSELFPKFLQKKEEGLLRCTYNMMAFSGSGTRVKPGPSRRSREIELVTRNALESVLDLSECPRAVINVNIELIQTDAGTRCAGICAASMALADAGFKMKDLVAAVSAGLVGDKIVLDLDYSEESFEEGAVDIPMAFMPRTGKIALLQLDGEITKEQLREAIKLAKKGCKQICEVQRQALKEKYKTEE
ncbi:exosome complex exonuclease Rrp41 [Candidatus Woesearchaeota archaeon]|nr:exosome complex exonuclease Rrp41 [Candidatus Woesearchaeota archaeon]